ncbi:MAG: non-heme iron oxygenase ferredoxin subunit [Candidatus Zixiibacteriota bacterium]|nr:MAG: non-heme iron oxygenase ferredoxin subunit [candidate division Zixibacteria bacterium]
MDKSYVKACRLGDVKENQATLTRVNGSEVLLIKMDGEVYACDSYCTHESTPLGEGEVINGEIQCMRHGARFDIKTGRATQMPAVIDIKTYAVKIVNDDVFIALQQDRRNQ